jgi:polyphosphate kinase 2 (PPK2 family)
MIVGSEIRLIKYWFEESFEEQQRCFRSGVDDPTKHWKLSPTDLESQRLWYEYSRAREAMLSQFPYEPVPFEVPKIPMRRTKHAYDDDASLAGRNFVPQKY